MYIAYKKKYHKKIESSGFMDNFPENFLQQMLIKHFSFSYKLSAFIKLRYCMTFSLGAVFQLLAAY